MTNDSWDSEKFQEVIAKPSRMSLLQILRYKSGHYEFLDSPHALRLAAIACQPSCSQSEHW